MMEGICSVCFQRHGNQYFDVAPLCPIEWEATKRKHTGLYVLIVTIITTVIIISSNFTE